MGQYQHKKNPSYADVKYVEALIGPDTINTLPMETLNAYRDHGDPAARLEIDIDKARQVLKKLAELGINLLEVTQQLEDEGIEKFVKPFNKLETTLEEKRKEALAESVDVQEVHLGEHKAQVESRISKMESSRFGNRLWRKDASLWKTDSKSQEMICRSMGWLHVADKMVHHVPNLQEFVQQVSAAGYRHVVHMGMGGSSLTPLVFQQSFATVKGGLALRVLDTTDPTTILKIEREVPLGETLFIVATKSGTTAEPLAFGEYFYDKVKSLKGNRAGENFVAITDPGSPLVELALSRNFRYYFLTLKTLEAAIGPYPTSAYCGRAYGTRRGRFD